jgi:long-chain acyl-CoA synthetase
VHPGPFARTAPDRPAIIMGGSGEIVTYRELDARSNRLAHALRSMGLRRGDVVAVLMENNARYHEVAWAARRSGLYLTVLNHHLNADEVTYIVNDCAARVLVASADQHKVAAAAPAGDPARGTTAGRERAY